MKLTNKHKYATVLFALMLLSQPLYGDSHATPDYQDLNPKSVSGNQ